MRAYLLQRVCVELRFINDFDGDLYAGEHMPREFDFGKVAFADSLQEAVLADVRLLVGHAG